MLSNAEIKKLKSLRIKKYRLEHGTFLVEGEKLVEEALHSDHNVRAVFYGPNRTEFASFERSRGASLKSLDRISALKTSPGVAAEVEIKPPGGDLPDGPVFIADRLNDPGNLGTLIRIADWFGIKRIYCSTGSVDAYNPKTVQASMGSIFRTETAYTDLTEIIKELKQHGYKVFAADLKGTPIYEVPFIEKCAVVLGSESHGLSPEVTEVCDERITVPGYGGAESLNVAVSGALIAGEMRRQLSLEVK